jgi:hypothetical protein
MSSCTRRQTAAAQAVCLIALAGQLFLIPVSARAGDPYSAYYHWSGSRLFWFMVISDIHVGASGSQDTEYLSWAVGPARQVINPAFIVATGDLTDSTNGGVIPNGPYTVEWQSYRNLLTTAGIDASFYYDIPGNHDHYNDETFAYYRTYSIQGAATGATQHSWTRSFPFGTYHFIGASTPGNDGAPFSIWPWENYGDNAGLDAGELAFIQTQLNAHPEAELTLIFGHHPFQAGYYVSSDTGLTYGLSSLLNLIDGYGVSMYGFGHTHNYRENFYYNNLSDGVFYLNVSSLGKEASNHFAVMAVDGSGLSVRPGNKGVWPVVLITAPVDRNLGATPQPFAYEIPAGRANPVRTLVFDPGVVSTVEFRVDGAGWQAMQPVAGGPLWQGFWDASAAAAGVHTIEVRAAGSTTRTDQVTTSVNPALCFSDADRDGDVDGSDLAALAADFVPETVADTAGYFGRTNCAN